MTASESIYTDWLVETESGRTFDVIAPSRYSALDVAIAWSRGESFTLTQVCDVCRKPIRDDEPRAERSGKPAHAACAEVPHG